MRQAGVFACLIVRCWCLEVELQRKLDVSRSLRGLNYSCRGLAYVHIGRLEVYIVERIEKVRPELELKSLCQLKILLKADVPVVITRPPQMTELGRAGSESSGRIRIVTRVKP